MRLYNHSFLPTDLILAWMQKYYQHFTLEVGDPCTPVILNGDGYPFIDDPNGVLVCHLYDENPAFEGPEYGGLTYGYGACTIFVSKEEYEALGTKADYHYELRILHEILHHFYKDSDGMSDWIESLPGLYKFLTNTLLKLSHDDPRTILVMDTQKLFYLALLTGVCEECFTREKRIESRTYQGVLK